MNLVQKKYVSRINKASLTTNCEFCSLSNTPENEYWIKDVENGSLYLNFNQSYLGRCIYIPKKHFNSLEDIDEYNFNLYSNEVLSLSKILLKSLNADLINIAMLGNKVHHVHWHLIPRYKNDRNWGEAPWPTEHKELKKQELLSLKNKILKHLRSLQNKLNGKTLSY